MENNIAVASAGTLLGLISHESGFDSHHRYSVIRKTATAKAKKMVGLVIFVIHTIFIKGLGTN
ncbi:MAG: hypothetical protein LBD41_01735 [Clostridiales Family XIII bacterium]|jgi:hypothetical protein|nr:hypothetical protein [Clostridiales Family XIII bacterium]